MTLGQRIKDRRKASGITQKDLAQNAQTTLQYISAIEQNKRIPSLPLIIKISEHLNVSLDYLVFGKEVIIDITAAIKADERLEAEAKKPLIELVRLLMTKNN